jgi:hypothetical protein
MSFLTFLFCCATTMLLLTMKRKFENLFANTSQFTLHWKKIIFVILATHKVRISDLKVLPVWVHNVSSQLFERSQLMDSWPYFTLPDSRLPQPGGPETRIYIPQEQGVPVITPGTGFPFRRLLRRATVGYSNTPPGGVGFQSVRVNLPLAVYRQSVRLGTKPLEGHDQREFL